MTSDGAEPRAGAATSQADARAEDALRVSEERLRAHIDNSPLAIIEFDPQLTVTRWSKEAERLFGWTAEEMIGRRIPDVRWVHEEDAESVTRESARLLSGAGTRTLNVNRNYRKDGSVVHCEWYSSAVHDPQGRLISILSQVLDVTDRKRAEEALRQSEATLRGFFDATGALMSLVELEDDDFVYLLANAEAARFFGRPVAAVAGRRGRELGLPEETVVEWLGHFRRCHAAQAPIALDYSVPRGGATAWFHGTVSPVPGGPSGHPRFAVVVVDLTERRRIDEELRETGERFRTLADNIAQLAWMADPGGYIFWFNERWLDFTGTTLEEAKGFGWKRSHHPDHLQRVVDGFMRCMESGEVWEDTFPLRRRDGAYRWFLSRAVPIRDERGGVLRWFGTNTDITELREAQRALAEADRRKTDFLAVLSHELRNRLSPIRMGLLLLDRAQGSAQQARAREIIRRQMDHVTRIVDDLLDVSRIDLGKLRLDRASLDARDVVHRACEDVRPAFEERGVTLRCELPSESLWVSADPTRLEQIVGNLLANSLKFTPAPGAVDVILRRRADRAELSVRDTGTGIEPQVLDRIFEPFAQAERPEGAARAGMGIGLALVKSLVEMHGGSVRAWSEGKGKGAELTVSLPLEPSPEATESGQAPTSPP